METKKVDFVRNEKVSYDTIYVNHLFLNDVELNDETLDLSVLSTINTINKNIEELQEKVENQGSGNSIKLYLHILKNNSNYYAVNLLSTRKEPFTAKHTDLINRTSFGELNLDDISYINLTKINYNGSPANFIYSGSNTLVVRYLEIPVSSSGGEITYGTFNFYSDNYTDTVIEIL